MYVWHLLPAVSVGGHVQYTFYAVCAVHDLVGVCYQYGMSVSCT
jgi:hypothetical protein